MEDRNGVSTELRPVCANQCSHGCSQLIIHMHPHNHQPSAPKPDGTTKYDPHHTAVHGRLPEQSQFPSVKQNYIHSEINHCSAHRTISPSMSLTYGMPSSLFTPTSVYQIPTCCNKKEC